MYFLPARNQLTTEKIHKEVNHIFDQNSLRQNFITKRTYMHKYGFHVDIWIPGWNTDLGIRLHKVEEIFGRYFFQSIVIVCIRCLEGSQMVAAVLQQFSTVYIVHVQIFQDMSKLIQRCQVRDVQRCPDISRHVQPIVQTLQGMSIQQSSRAQSSLLYISSSWGLKYFTWIRVGQFQDEHGQEGEYLNHVKDTQCKCSLNKCKD